MRVGIDGRLWNESGVGRYIRNLVFELAKIDKKNQYVLFLRSPDRVKLGQLPKNWKIVKVDIQWHSLKEQLLLPQILRKEKLDLVHFPYFSVPIFYPGKFVVTIHDLILHHFPTGEASTLSWPVYNLKLLGYRLITSQAAKRAVKIITVSETTKKEIIKHLGIFPNKIVVTYEGVNENSKFKIQNSKLQLKIKNLKSKSYFLYVGNAYPHKNLERLLEAFQEVKIQNLKVKSASQNLKLILVGKEDYFYRRLREKVRKLGLTKNIIFYGEATDEELSALYQNAKALILPSLMEGFGLPAVEAMANKCLVLASDIPAIREVCDGAAIYFNPLKIEDIAEKIKQVCYYDLNHWNKNKEKGLERVKMFFWEKMAKETLKVYQGI